MSIPSYEYSNETGLTPVEIDALQRINEINSLGNINTNIANIQAESQKKITKLNNKTQLQAANKQMRVGLAGAEAVKYTADQGLAGENVRADATRYISDRQLESNLGVENIRAKGALDLQGIVNAGMERVENIRGEYGVKGKKVDRSTAILGGLVSAFNF